MSQIRHVGKASIQRGDRRPQCRRFIPNFIKRSLFAIYKHLPRGLRWPISYALSRKFLVGMVFFVEREGALLLVRHSYQKAWSLPGGWLERGETIAQGAQREMREEFGVKVENIEILDVRPIIARPAIDILLTCQARGDLTADGVEIVEFAFCASDQLPSEILGGHRAYVTEFFRPRISSI